MTDMESKDAKLNAFLKEQVRTNLFNIGRKLVIEKGADYLTARKLSQASNVSVGTIYNQFSTMENFVAAENMQTFDELYQLLSIIIPDQNPYINIIRYVDAFSGYVVNNPNLWTLVFREQLQGGERRRPFVYLRKARRIEKLLEIQLRAMFGYLGYAERRLAAEVLETTLFALSGFLAMPGWDKKQPLNKHNICQLLLNTYLAGLASLRKE